VGPLELIGVPYTSMAHPGGIANGIKALREADLALRLRAVADLHEKGDLDLPQPSGVRARSGLLNEPELVRLVAGTRAAVASAHSAGRMPLLVGGDCPVLLGPLAALRDQHGAAALLMIDGHEDAWPPPLSPTGEASDSEIALAIGMVTDGLSPSLADVLPVLEAEALCLLGPRDAADIVKGGVTSLAEQIGLFLDDETLRRLETDTVLSEALEVVHRAASRFWLHLDLDALRSEDFPAADYLQPAGLSWQQWLSLVVPALADERCAGASVVIYNPDLDPDHRVAADVVARLSEAFDRASRTTFQ